MYDVFTSRYTFACPTRSEAHVALSRFRRVERLPGAAHPSVYRVRFECSCEHEHDGLVTHDELDWRPLGLEAGRFVNLMTGRTEEAGGELADVAARRIGAGEWPWSFFCYLEDRPQPVFPSSFLVVSAGDRAVALAARCPSCATVSVNLVSSRHLDEPFWNDPSVRVIEHVFRDDELRALDEFSAELYSARFDERRLAL